MLLIDMKKGWNGAQCLMVPGLMTKQYCSCNMENVIILTKVALQYGMGWMSLVYTCLLLKTFYPQILCAQSAQRKC